MRQVMTYLIEKCYKKIRDFRCEITFGYLSNISKNESKIK